MNCYQVDFWSLGATIYKLFTNDKPFADFSVRKLIEVAPLYQGDLKFISRYAILFQNIPKHPNINDVSMDIITKLLNVDETQRLGVGVNGMKELKSHPFFDGIDWEKVECKQLQPPHIPEPKVWSTTPIYESFADMMMTLGMSYVLYCTLLYCTC